jgi:hypothetical protein
MSPLQIPIRVGSESPASWDDIEVRQREFAGQASRWPGTVRK